MDDKQTAMLMTDDEEIAMLQARVKDIKRQVREIEESDTNDRRKKLRVPREDRPLPPEYEDEGEADSARGRPQILTRTLPLVPRPPPETIYSDYLKHGHILHSWPWEKTIRERVFWKLGLRPDDLMAQFITILEQARDQGWEEYHAACDRRAAVDGVLRPAAKFKCRHCDRPLLTEVDDEPVHKTRPKADSTGSWQKRRTADSAGRRDC